ncbi:MAG: hypothetical protein ACRCTY_04150 [Candidatus Adiutrix sp.]
MTRKRIFVCSPYAGNIAVNVELARMLCRKAIADGHAPFAPHLMYPGIVDDLVKEDREKGIDCGLTFMESCDEMWVYSGEKDPTSGMKKEIKHARKIGIPIKDFLLTKCSSGDFEDCDQREKETEKLKMGEEDKKIGEQ